MIDFVFWHWWLFALLLLLIELLSLSFFFLALCVAAVITGFVVLFIEFLTINSQLLVFLSIALLGIVGWYTWRKQG